MSDLLVRFSPWMRDVALAYVGGLVIGAPVAVTLTYITGIERLATVGLLGAMLVVLWALRQQRAGRVAAQPGPAPLTVSLAERTRHAA